MQNFRLSFKKSTVSFEFRFSIQQCFLGALPLPHFFEVGKSAFRPGKNPLLTGKIRFLAKHSCPQNLQTCPKFHDCHKVLAYLKALAVVKIPVTSKKTPFYTMEVLGIASLRLWSQLCNVAVVRPDASFVKTFRGGAAHASFRTCCAICAQCEEMVPAIVSFTRRLPRVVKAYCRHATAQAKPVLWVKDAQAPAVLVEGRSTGQPILFYWGAVQWRMGRCCAKGAVAGYSENFWLLQSVYDLVPRSNLRSMPISGVWTASVFCFLAHSKAHLRSRNSGP